MNLTATLFVTSILGLACARPAAAGPSEGDLFGYKLGSRYPVTEKTQGYTFAGSVALIADRPDVSSDFARVEMVVTPKTFTIANIYAVAEFDAEEPAKVFARKYADLLDALHGTKCLAKDNMPWNSLRLECASKYHLSVSKFDKNKDEKHVVHVGLEYRPDGPEQARTSALFQSEWKQLEQERKRRQLNEAANAKKLQGLQ